MRIVGISDTMRDQYPNFYSNVLLVSAILMLVVALGLMSAVPPVSRDALTHHLAVPKLYIEVHRIAEFPDVIPSYYPMNMDLLYLLPLIWGNDILPKYIHLLFGLFTSAIVYRYLRHRLSPTYGLLGVLLFLSLPVIIQLCITVYVDLGLIFFSTAALIALLEWRASGWKNGKLIFAAVMCGLAMGTKYNGLIVFFILTLMVPFIHNRKAIKARVGENTSDAWLGSLSVTFVFAAVALVLFSPWALRNLIWTGNPIYPLYDVIFNPQNPYVETRLNPFAIRRMVYGENLWATLLVPLRIFFEGQDNVPALFDGRLNPGLLIFSVIGLVPLKRQKLHVQTEKMIWGAFALLFILIVFFTRDMRIRYIAPAIPALVILSVFGVWNLFHGLIDHPHKAMLYSLRIGTAILIVAFLSMNVAYLAQKWQDVRPMAYLSGNISRAAYITRYRPEYEIIQHVNQNLKADDRVLCVFLGNRRYYFDVATLFLEWHAFQEQIENAADAQALSNAISAMQISHLMVNMDNLDYWSQQGLSSEKQTIMRRWIQNHLQMVKESSGYALFKLQQETVTEGK
jgi:4-amino-4-deoxy-L-arabinose transferase-like glycosyltransferase